MSYFNFDIAMDKDTARVISSNGYMDVKNCNISKAQVSPYFGREIPRWKELGLKPDQIYKLYRDPAELARGASTFNMKPLLKVHQPMNVLNHEQHAAKVVGTLSNVQFSAPYLTADVCLWTNSAIAGVESDKIRQLSCGYDYTADMTPGEVDDEAYDGIMRNIVGNHVTLVEAGRAGPDVLVQDSEIDLSPIYKRFKMSVNSAEKKAALKELIKAKMAGDEAPKACEMVDAIDEDPDAETEAERKDRLEKRAEDKKAADKKARDEQEMTDEEKEKAMDAAISAAVAAATAKLQADNKALREAEILVRPIVGNVHGMDSAEAVLKFALDKAGVDHSGISDNKALTALVKVASSKPGKIAMDSNISADTGSVATALKILAGVSHAR